MTAARTANRSATPLLILMASVWLAAGAATAEEDAGARIAQEGNDRGATACIQCHGAQGQGQAQPPFPRLAGLPEQYLIEQMDAYQDGRRANPTMAQIARNLDDDEIQAISRHYAEMEPAGGPYNVPEDLINRGREIALEGLPDRNIQSCATCHGQQGRERNPSLPPLAGHPPRYLMAQLQAYAEGARETPLAGLMQGIVSELAEEEQAALAAYYASLPASDQ